MILQNPNGSRFAAVLTTEHPASGYGRPVLVISPIGSEWSQSDPIGTAESAGLYLVESSIRERRELDAAGYRFAPTCGRCAGTEGLRTVVVGRPERVGYPAPHAETVCGPCEDALRSDGQVVPRGTEPHKLAWVAAVVKAIRDTPGHGADNPAPGALDRFYHTHYEPSVAASEWIKAHPDEESTR